MKPSGASFRPEQWRQRRAITEKISLRAIGYGSEPRGVWIEYSTPDTTTSFKLSVKEMDDLTMTWEAIKACMPKEEEVSNGLPRTLP